MLGIGWKWNKCVNSFITHVSQHVLIVVIATTIILQIRKLGHRGIDPRSHNNSMVEPGLKSRWSQTLIRHFTTKPKLLKPMSINEIQFSWDILMTKSAKYNKSVKPCFQPFQNLRTWNDVWIPFVCNILNSVIIISVNDLMGIIPRIFLWNNPNWSIIYL